MAEYALSTDLYSFAQATAGFFGWPTDAGEAEIIRKLEPGDIIVPKFARNAHWGGRDTSLEQQRSYCEQIGLTYDEVRDAYAQSTRNGEVAVPFLMHVQEALDDDHRPNPPPWARVAVSLERLAHPLSSAELLRLRRFPSQIAQQFKGAVAPGRHLQELPDGVADAVRAAAATPDRARMLREYTLVEATSVDEAVARMEAAGRSLLEGDRCFIVAPGGLLGVHEVQADGSLTPLGREIPKTLDELHELFQEAERRATPADQLRTKRTMKAISEMAELLAGPVKVRSIDNFATFHDRYTLFNRKVTQALDIAKRPFMPGPGVGDASTTTDDEATETEVDELAAIDGLDVDSVKQALPDGMVLPDSVLKEAVTALRARKHLLLSGPPGTGKSTLAEALCAAVEIPHDVVTATADWTTFDTIGGYMPHSDGGLSFEPGIVLRCLQRGRWLVVDELNRADIDKAFGPLFTLLAGGSAGTPNPRVVLPYHRDGTNIEIRWAETRARAKGDYILTPGWRLIGTLNVSDKATLFQLSFAFLRRFAVIEVPLPARDAYEAFFRRICGDLPTVERDNIVTAAMRLAFNKGRELGPAILRDIAEFTRRAMTEVSTGQATYDDWVEAFVTAVRLFAVPQYEGATSGEAASVLKILQDMWPGRPAESWELLREALDAVSIA